MILSDVLAAITNYYFEALEDGGRPIGDGARYVGATDWKCCTPNAAGDPAGALRVYMPRLGSSERPPAIFPVWGKCPPKPVMEIRVRVLRCWPAQEDSTVEEFDAASAEIYDDAWILSCSTVRLMNSNTLALCSEDLARLGCTLGGWTLEVVPPSGGCVGAELTLYASVTGPCSIVEDSGG